MANYPEIGQLENMDIYADETRDGKYLKCSIQISI